MANTSIIDCDGMSDVNNTGTIFQCEIGSEKYIAVCTRGAAVECNHLPTEVFSIHSSDLGTG